jgi:hypothetical protein
MLPFHHLDSDLDLDTSWITETERFQHLDTIASKELSSYLNTCYLCINANHEIVSVKRDKIVFDASATTLSSTRLLELSQPYSNYVLKNILLFHVPIEPQHILSFSKSDHSFDIAKSFLHHYVVTDSITIPPSIFIFHSIHTLYFFFHEESKAESKAGSYADRHKVTKRVRMKLPKSTRKYRP